MDAFQSLNGYNSEHEILSLNILYSVKSAIDMIFFWNSCSLYIVYDKESHRMLSILRKYEARAREREDEGKRAKNAMFFA